MKSARELLQRVHSTPANAALDVTLHVGESPPEPPCSATAANIQNRPAVNRESPVAAVEDKHSRDLKRPRCSGDSPVASQQAQLVQHVPAMNDEKGNLDGSWKSFSAEMRAQVDRISAESIAGSQTTASIEGLLLSDPRWGLPVGLVRAYAAMGLHSMYGWQRDCLALPHVLDGTKNLVYAAPTSAGKTLVAELVALTKVLRYRRKVLFILPYVSLVTEKTVYMRKTFEGLKIRSSGHFAQSDLVLSNFDQTDMVICTIEKANSLVNRLIDEARLDVLGVVVVDELHMIGDDHRGYLLELLLTKVKYILRDRIQILGMSATLPNIELLASWLDAWLYVTDFRPVPLREYVVIKNQIFNGQLELVRTLPFDPHPEDPDFLVPLCYEVVSEGKSVLIFCSSKDRCEKCAFNVAALMRPQSTPVLSERRQELIVELSKTPTGLDPYLERCLLAGVAYHHAGLTMDERRTVETGFRNGAIQVLTATTTLASGVNLPARRVILRSPYMGRNFLDSKSYQQMRGRAGRKGQDTYGESFLIANDKDRPQLPTLLSNPLEPVSSCLVKERRGMKRALLEVIASGIAKTQEAFDRFGLCTMLTAEKGSNVASDMVEAALDYLVSNALIVKERNEAWTATKLGLAVVASSLSPEEGCLLYHELKKGMRRFVLSTDLCSIYHITPLFLGHEPHWPTFYRLYSELDETALEVGQVIGIDANFLAQAAQGFLYEKTDSQKLRALSHRRFQAALILHDLIREVPLSDVSRKYNVNRGVLQTLQTTAASFAGMVNVFCEKLKWSNLLAILSQFQERLEFGVMRDLVDLCRITHIQAQEARILFNCGFRDVESVACTSADCIARLLRDAKPFSSTTTIMDDSIVRRAELRLASQIVEDARRLAENQATRTTMNTAHQTGLISQSSAGPTLSLDLRSPRTAPADFEAVSLDQKWVLLETELNESGKIYVSLYTISDQVSVVAVTISARRVFLCEPKDRCWAEVWATVFATADQIIVFDYRKFMSQHQHITLKAYVAVADWLLDPEGSPKTLDDCIHAYIPTYTCPAIFSSQIACCQEVLKIFALMEYFERRLKLAHLYRYFVRNEMTAMACLHRMETTGIPYDPKCFLYEKNKFQESMSLLEESAYRAAGTTFDLSSPESIRHILFEHLKLESPFKNNEASKNRRRFKSTNKDNLLRIAHLHPLPKIIMEWRRLQTVLLKHIAPLSEYLHDDTKPVRIHAAYSYRTSTGRAVTYGPNLQTVPSSMEIPADGKSSYTLNLRKAFPASPGFIFLSADFSQLELRFITHLSQEPTMLAMMRTVDVDVFREMAAEWESIPVDQVTDAMRKQSKMVCYGVLYGMGPHSLAQDLGLTKDEADTFVSKFQNRYPSIQAYNKTTVADARASGYVETLCGRRRLLPDLQVRDKSRRSRAERQAVNTVIQGSSADLMKRVLVLVEREMTTRYPTNDVRMVLQLHDEVLFEVRKEHLHSAAVAFQISRT